MKNIFLLALLFLPTLCLADSGAQAFHFMSGTGFFVNNEYVVTNAHVVNGCNKVVIHGPVPEQVATVEERDPEHDPALLKTTIAAHQVAPMRFDLDTMQVGDKVYLIGYPGVEGAAGKYKFVEAEIPPLYSGLNNPDGRFYITDKVEHGDSGGPVFDAYGNVIGVMVAISGMTQIDRVSGERINEQRLGVVISLATVKKFLTSHSVYTQWVGSGSRSIDPYIEETAKAFIVNIICAMPVAPPEKPY